MFITWGRPKNAAFKERLGVFALLPLGCPSNGVKDDTFLPLLPPQAVTNPANPRSLCACSGNACRKGMMVALWTLHATRTNAICRVRGCRAEMQMWECHRQLRTDGSPVGKHKHKRTAGSPSNSTEPGLTRALGLQLLPQVYGLLCARPPSTICFLGNQRPSTATSTYTCSPDQSQGF